jgi:hypothetical protein
VSKASSSKKIARLAASGSRKRVRSQQGLLFPVSIAVVIALGLLLIVYARQSSRQRASATAPILNVDHWHAAYGIYGCDKFLTPIQVQTDEYQGTPVGIHTHGDGAIHIHPFTNAAAGERATTGWFFKTTGMTMTTKKMVLPDNGGTFKDGDDCGGKPGHLKVLVWHDQDPNVGSQRYNDAPDQVFVAGFDKIKFTEQEMALTFAFVNDDADFKTLRPPTAILNNLNDTGATTATTVPGETTVPGATTVPGETTVPGATTVPGETTVPGATTVPSATTPTATTAAAAAPTTGG